MHTHTPHAHTHTRTHTHTHTPQPSPPKDWLLFIIAFALVGIDMIILLVPMAIDTARLRASLRLNQEQPPRKNVRTIACI